MGLDMYLEARIYGGQFLNKEYFEMFNAVPIDWPVKPESFELKAQVGYWRKANQIHGWFVENVQGGQDDCRSYWVSKEQLIELRDLCQRVIDSGDPEFAKEHLPPSDGFFFGSNSIDDYYWTELRDTIAILSRVINWQLLDDADIHYRASW